MNKFLVSFVIAVAVIGQNVLAELPDGITGCSVSSDFIEFNRCALDQFEKYRPHMTKIMECLALDTLEPYNLPILKVHKEKQLVSVNGAFTDIKMIGFSGFVIEDIGFSPDDLTANISIRIPKIELSAVYNLDGKLLKMKLPGTGNFDGNFENTLFRTVAKAKIVKDAEGIERFVLDDLVTTVEVNESTINLTGSGLSAIPAMAIKTFYNRINRSLMLNAAQPVVDKKATEIVRNHVEQALVRLRVDEILVK